MKLIAWRDPGAKLAVQGEERKKPSWIRTRLGFYLLTLYIVDLESNPETQPSHIKGWEGDPRTPRHFFATIHLSTRNLESSPLFG
jgi:hypothetical protein